MPLRRFYVVFTLIFVGIFTVQAQKAPYATNPYRIRANVQHGAMLPEYAFMSYLSDDYVRGFEINFLKMTTGKSVWHQLYRYPGFGVSFHFSTLGSERYFGKQYSLYPYYSMNILRKRRFDLSYQMGLGVSYATKKYSHDSNYQNVAIGSYMNIHYHADLIGSYRINENFSLNAGIAFSHISNANLSEPNVGLNLCSVYIGAAYAFGKKDSARTFDTHMDPFFSYEIMLAGGMKHTRTFESFRYPAVSISFDAKRRIGYKFAWGLGADLFYDSSTQPQMERLGKEFSSSDAYTSGVHISAEFVYDKFSLIVQQGVYVGLPEKLFGYSMYNRVMTRYKFSEHFFANFSLKSHLYILDFPELGVGYYW